MAYDIDAVRAEFPALHVRDGDRHRVYLDAPGGTQVCRRAIGRMVAHLESGTANAGGAFATSRATDALSRAAHEAVADLLGGAPGEIAFGPNMTSLTFAVSRALGRRWFARDEIVLTRMDHDANVAPWLQLARDHNLSVRWLDWSPATGRFDLAALPRLLSPRTRLVAVPAASNALGTLNDIAEIAHVVRRDSPALIHVDGVQSVPHVATDVRALGVDLFACSPYKVFGPHQGVLWGRAELLGEIEAYKVRPAADSPSAVRFETGTPSWEGQAGTLGAVEHIAWIGATMADARHRPPDATGRRADIVAGMNAVAEYEAALGARLLDGLLAVPGLTLHGPPTAAGRVPTFAFTLAGKAPRAVAEALADRGIFVWSGNFYAVEVAARLGLADTGMVRVGLCQYSTADEVDALLAALGEV